jgi:hypothetical protein
MYCEMDMRFYLEQAEAEMASEQADSGSDGWPVNARTASIDWRKPPTGPETMAE